MIELYVTENCPYCAKVRRFMEEAGVAYVLKPVSLGRKSKYGDELKSLGGKVQVPYLVDPEKNQKMYESLDIIDYVKENYAT